jgi:signal transduction histidine kinase
VGADRATRQAVAGVVKIALNLRLLALLLTLLWLPAVDRDGHGLLTGLLVVGSVTSLVPVLRWDRVGSWVLSHPSALLPDLLAAMVVLGAVGLDTPFGLFVLATALAAGVLYGWAGAGVMSGALLLAYVGGASLSGELPTVAEALGTPALVPGLALGGAGIRTLLLRQQATAAALAESSMTTAAAKERTRLAREMHDTLAKTLHGIALNATAVPRLLEHDPRAAAVTAAGLAETAERAAQEARELITDLRTDDLERPLGPALREAVAGWAEGSEVRVVLDVDDACGLSPSVRYELFCIAREALRNAVEHGDPRTVAVSLRDGEEVVLTVRDDGDGFAAPADLDDLADDGHFGVVGMGERARTVGGRLRLVTAPGRGTTVTVTVPRAAPGEAEGQTPPPGIGAMPPGRPRPEVAP